MPGPGDSAGIRDPRRPLLVGNERANKKNKVHIKSGKEVRKNTYKA